MARAISRSSDAKSQLGRSFRCWLSKSDLTSISRSAWNVSKTVGAAAHSVIELSSQSQSFSECCDFHFMILYWSFQFETRPLGNNGARVIGQLSFTSNHRRIACLSKLIPVLVIIGCCITECVIGHRNSSGTSLTWVGDMVVVCSCEDMFCSRSFKFVTGKKALFPQVPDFLPTHFENRRSMSQSP